MEIAGYIVTILMGLTLGIIGAGGSILTVPILAYFFKQDALLATTGSLFVVGTTALLGAIMNAKRGLVDVKTGFTFALPSFVGVYFARQVLLPSIPDSFHIIGALNLTKSIFVLTCFAVLMIFASRAMINSGTTKKPTTDSLLKPGFWGVAYRGFLVGTTTGFVGAGGGFLIIPALVLLLGLSMQVAVGTSLAIITANSLFGFAISYNSAIDWKLLLTLALLGSIGLVFGTRISSRFRDAHLKQGFGYFVLVIGVFILADQLRRVL
ncbi:MAG: sulfite exporter TauE/SafE family protein [Bdellovibrionia bacterium]